MNISYPPRKCSRTRSGIVLSPHHIPSHKLAIILPAAALLLLGNLSAIPQPDLLDFSTGGDFTNWTKYGAVAARNTTEKRTLGDDINGPKKDYFITPAVGTYMAVIQPYGNTTNSTNIDSILGLTSGTLSTLFSGLAEKDGNRATNFGVLTRSLTLTAGTYEFAWAYGAQDYKPYNDGVLFALSGNGIETVAALACNGPTGAQGSTLVLGSFGFAPWSVYSFSIPTTGTYRVSFADYNWGDTSVLPLFYIGNGVGTIDSGSKHNIDTNAAYYLASNLGTTVNPVFAGGTLVANGSGIVSNAFTVTASGGTIQATSGATTVFSGVISNADSAAGPFTITSAGTGGVIVFTGANTYTGPTTIATGATLQLSNTGSLASPTISIAAGGTLLDANGGLAPTAAVTANGQLTLGANQTLGSLTGSGTIGLGSSTLTIGGGTFSGAISGSGSLFVSGGSGLTLNGANTFTGPTTVSQGQLILNGSLAGNVNVGTGGILGGYGTIGGSLTASGGIVSPGNSPGILTVGGNYTEAGTLRIEIDGTAGAGVNPGGHDQIAVGGTATLQTGSTLQLTRTNTFEPAWGQRFRVIAATRGISGTFSTLDRSTFSTQLLFDYGTGEVLGTGLAAGAPIGQFATGSTNRNAVLGSISADAITADSTGQLSFIDSRTAAGSLFKSLLNSSAPVTVLDVLSPVAYAGTADYALQVTRNFSRDLHYVPTLASANGWTLSAGYTGYRNGISKAAADDTNSDLRSNAAVVDVGRKLGERLTIGGFFAADDGAVRARRFASDVTGKAVGLHLSWQPWTERHISLEGGASYGTYDFDNRRATTLGTATSKTDADVYDLWGRAKAGIYHTDRLGLSAFTGIAYTHAEVSSFTEKGTTDALALGKIKDELVIGDIGAELSLKLGSRLQLVGEAAFEHNFQNPRREVFARFTNSTAQFRVTAHGFDEDAVRCGLRAEYSLSDRTKLSAHYSAAISSSSEASQTFGGKLQYRF